jgi:hypothetical protein
MLKNNEHVLQEGVPGDMEIVANITSLNPAKAFGRRNRLIIHVDAGYGDLVSRNNKGHVWEFGIARKCPTTSVGFPCRASDIRPIFISHGRGSVPQASSASKFSSCKLRR